jgi:hypothetical protein
LAEPEQAVEKVVVDVILGPSADSEPALPVRRELALSSSKGRGELVEGINSAKNLCRSKIKALRDSSSQQGTKKPRSKERGFTAEKTSLFLFGPA